MSIQKLVGKWIFLVVVIIILEANLIEASTNCTGATGFNSFGQCVPCADATFCTSCSNNNTFCVGCYLNRGAAPNGTCISCSALVQKCIWCWTDYTICRGCADYFGLFNSTFCTNCSDFKCWRCASNYKFCTACVDGYGSWNGTCLPCNTNCTMCSNNNYTNCTACLNGYALLNWTCRPCDTNCVTCNSTNYTNCTSCISGYAVQNWRCRPCNTNCLTCHGINYTNCTSCIEGYALQNWACRPCNTNCTKCLPLSYTTCTFCSTGYALQNKACRACNTNCVACDPFSYTNCTSCLVGYALQNNTCRECDTNCITCQPLSYTNCSSCKTGYALDNKTCQPCDTNCLTCQPLSYTNCTSCKAGYAVENNTCRACNTNCVTCQTLSYRNCTSCVEGYALENKACQPCDTNCVTCQALSYTNCTSCIVGYALQNNTCRICGTNCLKCQPMSYTKCILCMDGYAVENKNCRPCDFNCLTCENQSYTNCTSCVNGYAIQNYTCRACNTNCLTCQPLSYINCTSCNTGYALYNNTCRACDINCVRCQPLSYTNCTSCITGYALQNNICRVCNTNCLTCQPLSYTNCTSCKTGFILQNNTCSSCNNNCLTCQPDSFVNCASCKPGYALQNKFCRPCDTNCLTCMSLCYKNCTSCVTGYAIENNTCRLCNTNCLTCQPFSTTNCTSCATGYYLSNTKKCINCLVNCTSCQNGITCKTCATGYYMSLANFCYDCPIKCSTCTFQNNISNPQCFSCQDGYQTPPICSQICGDSKTSTYSCDNQLGVPWDGCNNSCEVEPYFKCEVTSSLKTICAYNNTFTFKPVSINRNFYQNHLILQLQIYPPLHIFKTASQNQMMEIFNIINNDFTVRKIQYNPQNSHITFNIDFNNDISNQQQIVIEINQFPGYSVHTVKDNNLTLVFQSGQLFYYSDFSFNIQRIGVLVSYCLTALGYLSLFFGLMLERLAGLQAMVLLQFSWLPLLWLNSDFHPFLQSVYPLKYTTGYNYLEKGNQTMSVHYPYTSYFSMDPILLSRNFNIFILLQILPTLAAIFFFERWNNFVRRPETISNKSSMLQSKLTQTKQIRNSQIIQPVLLDKDKPYQTKPKSIILDEIIQERQQKKSHNCVSLKVLDKNVEEKTSNQSQLGLTKSQKDFEQESRIKNQQFNQKYRYSLYCLMYACIFNMVRFISSSALFFKQSNQLHLPSLVIFIISIILYLIIFLKFAKDPTILGCFYSSFKTEKYLARIHYFIYITVISVSIIIIQIFPNKKWFALPPLCLMCIYLLMYKPYFYDKQNYRSAYNFFVMCCWISLSILCQYYSNQKICYIILILNLAILLPSVLLFSFISTFYYNHYQKLVRNQSQQQQSQAIQNSQQKTTMQPSQIKTQHKDIQNTDPTQINQSHTTKKYIQINLTQNQKPSKYHHLSIITHHKIQFDGTEISLAKTRVKQITYEDHDHDNNYNRSMNQKDNNNEIIFSYHESEVQQHQPKQQKIKHQQKQEQQQIQQMKIDQQKQIKTSSSTAATKNIKQNKPKGRKSILKNKRRKEKNVNVEIVLTKRQDKTDNHYQLQQGKIQQRKEQQ